VFSTVERMHRRTAEDLWQDTSYKTGNFIKLSVNRAVEES